MNVKKKTTLCCVEENKTKIRKVDVQMQLQDLILA